MDALELKDTQKILKNFKTKLARCINYKMNKKADLYSSYLLRVWPEEIEVVYTLIDKVLKEEKI